MMIKGKKKLNFNDSPKKKYKPPLFQKSLKKSQESQFRQLTIPEQSKFQKNNKKLPFATVGQRLMTIRV